MGPTRPLQLSKLKSQGQSPLAIPSRPAQRRRGSKPGAILPGGEHRWIARITAALQGRMGRYPARDRQPPVQNKAAAGTGSKNEL